MTKIEVGDFTRCNIYYASVKFTQPPKRKEITNDAPPDTRQAQQGTDWTLATNPRNAADQTLFRDDNIAALDWPWEIGPLNRDVAEVHRNAGTHQRVGLVADVEVQMRLGRIARGTEFPDHVAGFHLVADVNAHTARLQMRVQCVLILSVINHHVVACDRR